MHFQELKIQNLSKGVYKLEFKGNSDVIITKIKINTNPMKIPGGLDIASEIINGYGISL